MTISELAKSFGVRPSALRFYERVGLLSPAGRISGRRSYDEAGERRLAFILSGRESGFTLSEIRDLISSSLNGTSLHHLWPRAAKVKRVRLENEIGRLQKVLRSLDRKAACQCRTLSDCERKLAKERFRR